MNTRRWWLPATVTTLLLVGVAFAVGWWLWAKWPQRKLSALCEAMAQGNFDRAGELVERSCWVRLSNGLVRFDINDVFLGLYSNYDVTTDEEWRLIFRKGVSAAAAAPFCCGFAGCSDDIGSQRASPSTATLSGRPAGSHGATTLPLHRGARQHFGNPGLACSGALTGRTRILPQSSGPF
jgi:hypothetical protein